MAGQMPLIRPAMVRTPVAAIRMVGDRMSAMSVWRVGSSSIAARNGRVPTIHTRAYDRTNVRRDEADV